MPEIIDANNSAAEVQEKRLSYISRMRSAVANELKLTFSLPNPFEGLLRDLAIKGIGFANIAVAGAAQLQENTGLNHEVVMKNHGSAVAAGIGVTCILGANLLRRVDKQDAEEWEASQVPKTPALV